MKYFLDTEFIEYPGCIDLISIGIVAEDGREFYAESTEVDWSKASPWVIENVKSQLLWLDGYVPGAAGNDVSEHVATKATIGATIKEFVTDPHPEFWAYYADYDWVAFCWLFGTMLELPDGWPKFCVDLKQWNVQLGERKLPEQSGIEHNALADARWLRDAWIWIDEYLASGDW